ncbi:MFS transporter [Microbacterium hatanonis]|uniref:MFS transporter n=1 Tax=Microbacterium hatanonis TaxID=404366 RepID=UPI001650C1DA|nr:MFS transporter [Microbacterium hatanonis]
MTADARRPPLPRSLGWVLGSGTVLQGLNSSLIAVAIVSVGAWFGAGDQLPWLVSAFYIACAVASPVAGRLVDLFGARRMYLVGLGIVLVAAVFGPFVPTMDLLVADRVLLGVGASLHFPAAMSIIRRQAAEREADGRPAIGVIALCGQTTAAIGPTLGGLIVTATGWQGIFWVNVPIVLTSALLVVSRVPREAPPGRYGVREVTRLLDPGGLVLFVAALVLTMMGLLALADVVGGDLTGLVVVAASLPLWAAFVFRELRARTPLLDLRLLARHKELTATCARAVVTFIAFYAVFYGFPQWLEAHRGLSPAVVGLVVLPVFGVGVASTILATTLGRRLSPRSLLIVGGIAFAAGGGVLAVWVSDDAPLWLLIAAAALLGVPNGFNNIGNQLILHDSVPADAMGMSSGLYRTSQYVGAALSSVVVAALIGTGLDDGGIRRLGVAIAGIGLLLAVLSVFARAKRRRAE